MRRRNNSGLVAGQLETHPIAVLKMHFGMIEEDFEIDDPVFKALQALCMTNDFIEANAQAKKKLSDDQFGNYDLIGDFFVNAAFAFRNLNLTKNDVIEVQYAMQNALFQQLCRVIDKKPHSENYAEWKQQVHRFLTNKYRALPSVNRVPPNYRLAAQQATFAVAVALTAAFMILKLAFRFYELLNYHEASKTNPELMSGNQSVQYFLGGGILLAYTLFRAPLLLMRDARNFRAAFNNVKNAMSELVFPRTIYATAPELLNLSGAEDLKDQQNGQDNKLHLQ